MIRPITREGTTLYRSAIEFEFLDCVLNELTVLEGCLIGIHPLITLSRTSEDTIAEGSVSLHIRIHTGIIPQKSVLDGKSVHHDCQRISEVIVLNDTSTFVFTINYRNVLCGIPLLQGGLNPLKSPI